jgi:hypothetical protein
MIVDRHLREILSATFGPLAIREDSDPLPGPRSLTMLLEKIAPDETGDEFVDTATASHFATAAIDIWLRSVHSFLISVSLTECSPIWASICGYYASHYSVRAVAHVLGFFQLFRKKKLVQLKVDDGRCICVFRKKAARSGEHQIYWRLVKHSTTCEGDDIFTENDQESEDSDARHRNHANYSDHLFQYPDFTIADAGTLKDRIDYISKIVFDAAPLPRINKFPDIEFVQLIAYHRIVSFRRLLDETLGTENKFWMAHRNPRFAEGFMDFQLADGAGLSQLGT